MPINGSATVGILMDDTSFIDPAHAADAGEPVDDIHPTGAGIGLAPSCQDALADLLPVFESVVLRYGRTAGLAGMISIVVDASVRWGIARRIAGVLRRNATLLDYTDHMRSKNGR